MARWMSMMLTRGLLMWRRRIKLTRTVMLPHTEMTSRTLYVAMDTMWPSLNVMSMGNVLVSTLAFVVDVTSIESLLLLLLADRSV